MKRNLFTLTILFSVSFFLEAAFENNLIPVINPICKDWQLKAVIIDGIEVEPGAALTDDKLFINEDNTIQTVLSGISLDGTWRIDQSNTWLTITSNDLNSAIRLKILSITSTAFKVERRNGEGFVTTLLFEPV